MGKRRYLLFLIVVFDKLGNLFWSAQNLLGCCVLFDLSYDHFEVTNLRGINFAKIICYLYDVQRFEGLCRVRVLHCDYLRVADDVGAY